MSKGRILAQLLLFVAILAAILFGSAGRLDWTMGWLYVAMYATVTVIGVLAVPVDPGLVEERTSVKEGIPKWDKWMVIAGTLLYPLAIFVVAGLDERFGWTGRLALMVQLVALLFALAGNLISIWATAVNRFYSRFVRIQRERGHVVISAGPYHYIRHPGYLGQIIFCLSTSIALGSLWALLPSGLFSLFLIIRTLLEDRFLQRELHGYGEYAARVRWRLVPGVW